MTKVIKKVMNLDNPIPEDSLNGYLFSNENKGHKFIISCTKGGELQTLTGSVTVRFMRANNTTILLGQGGSDGRENYAQIVDGNAEVTLHPDCYNVPGRFKISIFNISGDTVSCIYVGVGTVSRTQNGVLIDSGEIVPSIDELVGYIDDCITATENAEAAADHAVRYDVAQTLTDTQKVQARTNIDASSQSDVDDLKSTFENTLGQSTNLFNPDEIKLGLNPSGTSGYPKRALSGVMAVSNPSSIKAFALPSNLKYCIYYYDSNLTNKGNSGDWITNRDIKAYTQSYPYIRISFASVNNNDLTNADFVGLKMQVNVGATVHDWQPYHWAVDHTARNNVSAVESLFERTENLFNVNGVILGMNTAGNSGNGKRAVSASIPVSGTFSIKAYDLPANIKYDVNWADGVGYPTVGDVTGWVADTNVRTYSATHPYIRVLFGSVDDTNDLTLDNFKSLKLQINLGDAIKMWQPYFVLNENVRSDETKEITVLSYNLGHYAFGETDKYGIPNEIYNEKLLSLKRMFGRLNADIIGFQEYYRYISEYGTTPQIEANAVLFDYLYQYKSDTPAQEAIKSKFPVYNTGYQQLSTGRWYCYADCVIGGKSVYLISVHLSVGSDETALQKRVTEADEILAIISQHERVIVFGDFNVESDLEAIYGKFTEAGYKIGNCGFYGNYWTETTGENAEYNYNHYDNPQGEVYYIDNIIVSNNIVVSDAKAVNVYAESVSDHIPFMAKLRV